MTEREVIECVSAELKTAGDAWQRAARLIADSAVHRHLAGRYREQARRIGTERDYLDDVMYHASTTPAGGL